MGRYWRVQSIRHIGPTEGDHESILQKAQLDLNIRLTKKTLRKIPIRSAVVAMTETHTHILTEHKNVPYMGGIFLTNKCKLR